MTSVPCAPAPASPALSIHSEITISTLGGSKNPYPAQDLPSTVKGRRQVVLGVCACYACISFCACMPTCYAGRWAHRRGLGLGASTECNTCGRQLIFHGLGEDFWRARLGPLPLYPLFKPGRLLSETGNFFFLLGTLDAFSSVQVKPR